LRLKFFVSKGVFIHKITSEGCQTIREGRARVWEPENLAMVEGPLKKSKLPDFGRFKSGKKKVAKITRFRPLFYRGNCPKLPGKKVAENRVCRFKTFLIKAAQKKSNTNIQKHRTLSISPHSSRRRRVLV